MKKAPAPTVALLGAFTATITLAASPSRETLPEPSEVPVADFDKINAVTADDPNRFLVLGGVEVESPRRDLPDGIRAFLGRWEGYNTNLPAKKDLKVALVIRSIDNDRADAIIFYGYDLQFPTAVRHICFKVSSEDGVVLEAALQPSGDAGAIGHVKLRFQQESGNLTGALSLGGQAANYFGSPSLNSIELSRSSSFYVYKDYEAYLGRLRIYPERYKNEELNSFGNGYLVYLPAEYETDTGNRWPLLLFMHGMGDRGANVLLLAKASPFKMIREKGPLPFVIVAPLLSRSTEFFSFPGKYLEGVLDEITRRYRIDEKRVYLAGLSLGGEAAYRFALEHPEKVAAMASLSGLLATDVPRYYSREIREMDGISLSRLKDVPAWEIHGAGDAIVPIQLAKRLVEEFGRSGVEIRFTVLTDHDHDVWSDTFTDPEFYEWFLRHEKR